MNRRVFIKRLLATVMGIATLIGANGCMAPLISASARDKSAGDPWQCMNCGHLTRTTEDLAGTRCPRCTQRMLKRISEEQMAAELKKLGG
jgi:DNA-directed RNA polymerase subunit RPC12/RpoP